MARIAGVNIPTNKRVLIALQYIHGIGPKIAADIIDKVKIPEDRRVAQLSDQEVLQIREVIDRGALQCPGEHASVRSVGLKEPSHTAELGFAPATSFPFADRRGVDSRQPPNLTYPKASGFPQAPEGRAYVGKGVLLRGHSF